MLAGSLGGLGGGLGRGGGGLGRGGGCRLRALVTRRGRRVGTWVRRDDRLDAAATWEGGGGVGAWGGRWRRWGGGSGYRQLVQLRPRRL